MIQIYGKVISGQKYGRVLGFPTANLDRRQYVRDGLKIKLGVWSGEVGIRGEGSGVRRKAAIVIGPIDKSGLPKIEAHILNFKGDLYGKKITIELKKYLRPFKKYATVEALKAQIKKDINRVKK